MAWLRAALTPLLPTGAESLLFAGLWLKLLAFLVLLDHPGVDGGLGAVAVELLRSPLRVATCSLVFLTVLAGLNALPARWRAGAYQAASLVLGLLLLADLAYYRAFRSLPSFGRLGQYGYLALTPGLLAPLLHGADALVFLDLVLVRGWHRLPAVGRPDFRRLLLQGGVGLALLGLAVPLGAHRRGDLQDPVATARDLGPLGYHVLDLLASLGRKAPAPLTPAQRVEVAAWLESTREALPPGPDHGRCRGRNLLVIQVEALEAWALGKRVAGQEVTPCLDALQRRGWVFSNYFEQVREGVGSDPDLMANCSVYPALHDPAFGGFAVAGLPSLPRTLAAAGYTTLALRPGRGSLWNTQDGLRQVGFQHCLDRAAFDLADTFGDDLTDASLFSQVEPILGRARRPFYAFLTTQSSRAPYDLPDYVRELPLDPGLDQESMGGYLQAVHYADKQLGRFLAHLEASGLLADTLLAVTSNHRGVHTFCAPELARSPHREPWWEAKEPRLPLLLLAKGLAPRVLDVHAGQVDLMPTLLDLLGLPSPPGVMGRSLLSTRRDAVVLADGSIRGAAGPDLRAHLAAAPRIADLALRGGYYGEPLARLASR